MKTYITKEQAISVLPDGDSVHTFYDNPEDLNYCPICGRPLTQKACAELEKRLRG